MGVSNKTKYNKELTWLLGIHMSADGLLMPATHLAVLRIYWRHVHGATTLLKFDGDPFTGHMSRAD
eukprot:6190175-Pleurochrysis_carterae.AAC.4